MRRTGTVRPGGHGPRHAGAWLRRVPRPGAGRGTACERGSTTIEAVILVPAFGLFLGLIVIGGRIALADAAVQSAAAEAARTASLARASTSAQSLGRQAALDSLASQDLRCTRTTVTLDTSGFSAAVGTAASVEATVTCVVALDDLAVPGVPGSRTVEATMSSPIDTYRER